MPKTKQVNARLFPCQTCGAPCIERVYPSLRPARYCSRFCARKAPRNRQRPPEFVERDARIIALRESGLTSRAIGELVGLAPATVRKVLSRYG
jgi:DNA-binding NarL/FixJ family response regulator